MNNKKIFSKANSKTSFLAGVIVSTFVFLLFNSTTGITGEKLRGWGKNPDYNQGNADPGHSIGEGDHLERLVKYLEGGDILVLDEKGGVIARSPNKPIKDGPLTEHRTVSFVTVTENGYDVEKTDQKMGLLDIIISPAMAIPLVYERHYTIVDGDVIDCRIHRKSPAPHIFIKRCM